MSSFNKYWLRTYWVPDTVADALLTAGHQAEVPDLTRLLLLEARGRTDNKKANLFLLIKAEVNDITKRSDMIEEWAEVLYCVVLKDPRKR